MLKYIQKSFKNSVEKTSSFIKSLGPSRSSQLYAALLTCDEDKIILVYTTDSNGDVSTVYINPSLPFTSKRHADTTPLHLAASLCLERVVILFLKHEGNPNILNGRLETCLHCVCSKSDQPENRVKLLNLFLKWNNMMYVKPSQQMIRNTSNNNNISNNINGHHTENTSDDNGNNNTNTNTHTNAQAYETVSINRVDIDGNSAIHYAAIHGLYACVEHLVQAGSIISLVNYSQRTCCELADIHGHTDLAMMIELALVYQPEDENYVLYRQSLATDNNNSNNSNSMITTPLLTIPVINMDKNDMITYMYTLITEVIQFVHQSKFKHVVHISASRAEVLLNHYGWDKVKLCTELSQDPIRVYESCHLTPLPISYYLYTPDLYSQSTSTATNTTTTTTTTTVVLGESQELSSVCGICGETMLPELPMEQLYRLKCNYLNTTITTTKTKLNPTTTTTTTTSTHTASSSSESSQSMDEWLLRCITCGNGHHYCLSCWSLHNHTQILEYGSHIISCPGYKCGEILASYTSYLPSSTTSYPYPTTTNSHSSGGNSSGSNERDTMSLTVTTPSTLPMTISSSSSSSIMSLFLSDTMSPYTTNNTTTSSSNSYNNNVTSNQGMSSLTSPIKNASAVTSSTPSSIPSSSTHSSFSWITILNIDDSTLMRYQDQRYSHMIDNAKHMKFCHHDNCHEAIRWDLLCIQEKLPNIVVLEKDSDMSRNNNNKRSTKTVTSGYFDTDVMPQNMICPNGHAHCYHCNEEAHAPCTCTDWKLWRTRVDKEIKRLESVNALMKKNEQLSLLKDNDSMTDLKDIDEKDGTNVTMNIKKQKDDIANMLWVAANTKKCPRCSTPIEKDEGCNHMSCRKCRHEFCWICMKDWSLHNQKTGGYFQCNRFQSDPNDTSNLSANPQTNSGGDDDDDGGDDDYFSTRLSDDLGNAHMETIRMKQRGLRMARFIHHYTRFQAQSDSAQIEYRRKKVTLVRIAEGLLSTYKGDIKWLQGDLSPNPLLSLSGYTSNGDKNNQLKNNTHITNNSHGNNMITKTNSTIDIKEIQVLNIQLSPTSASDSSTSVTYTVEYIIKHHLQFLSEGFEELQRCRQLLKGSFAFAFYYFVDDQELYQAYRYDEIAEFLNATLVDSLSAAGIPAPHLTNNNTHGNTGNSSAINTKLKLQNTHKRKEKKRLYRRMSAYKSHFEQLQSELESLTETLSDVVARRRLRASKTQIIETTQASRDKRIEFEQTILMWSKLDNNNSNSSNSSSSYHDYEPSSYMSKTDRINNERLLRLMTARNERRRHPELTNHLEGRDAGGEDGSEEESSFLSALRTLDRVGTTTTTIGGDGTPDSHRGTSSSPTTNPTTNPATTSSRGTHIVRLHRERLQQLRQREEEEELYNINQAILLSLQEEYQNNLSHTNSPNRDTTAVSPIVVNNNSSNNSSSSNVNNNNNNNNSLMVPLSSSSDHQERSSGSPSTSTSIHDTVFNSSSSSNTPHTGPTLSTRTDINSPPSTTATAVAATVGDIPLNESDINILISMGFPREASIRALRRARGNMDRAADYLLSDS